MENLFEQSINRDQLVFELVEYWRKVGWPDLTVKSYDDVDMTALLQDWKDAFGDRPIPLLKSTKLPNNEIVNRGNPVSRIDEGLAALREQRKKKPTGGSPLADPRANI